MEYNNEAKLKEQNRSRLTDSKKELVLTKGVRWGMVGEDGWCVWCHREDSVAQRRQIGTLWHLTTLIDGDCNALWVGLNNKGECNNHIVFLVKPS